MKHWYETKGYKIVNERKFWKMTVLQNWKNVNEKDEHKPDKIFKNEKQEATENQNEPPAKRQKTEGTPGAASSSAADEPDNQDGGVCALEEMCAETADLMHDF